MFTSRQLRSLVEQGQVFPDPGERFLDIAREDVRWTYLGSPNGEVDAGIRQITL